ncbi:hypothetical protein GCM10022397_06300 [Flavivirga jejuensis]
MKMKNKKEEQIAAKKGKKHLNNLKNSIVNKNHHTQHTRNGGINYLNERM